MFKNWNSQQWYRLGYNMSRFGLAWGTFWLLWGFVWMCYYAFRGEFPISLLFLADTLLCIWLLKKQLQTYKEAKRIVRPQRIQAPNGEDIP